MGLRERQKTKRMHRILDAAAELFVQDGFEDVKAAAIAEKAEVAVGTLYNYFGGKNEILLTLTAIENERLEALGKAFTVDAQASVSTAFCTLINIYFDPRNLLLCRDLWRLGFALAFADVSSEEARRLRASDRVLSQQVVDLAHDLHAHGRLRQDLDCAAFGATIFNNANMLFFEFTRSENTDYADLNKKIICMTDAIVALALPVEDRGTIKS